MELDRPIFIVGHARGGSTLLGAVVNWHSYVGPKHECLKNYQNINEFLDGILKRNTHLAYSEFLEKKEVWFDYFPGRDSFAHMGKELIIENLNLKDSQKEEFVERLTEGFTQKRFLSKSPTNSFRVKIIKELFPEAKIVAIYRRGPDVVNSWIKRFYGPSDSARWWRKKHGKMKYKDCIKLLSEKWYETIEYLESCRREMDFLAIKYEDFTKDTSYILEKVMRYLELPSEEYIYNLKIDDRSGQWKKHIPWWYHKFLIKATQKGNEILEKI